MTDIPRNIRKLYATARESTSRKAAIKFHCLECCGFERREVAMCTVKECVFYKYRLKG